MNLTLPKPSDENREKQPAQQTSGGNGGGGGGKNIRQNSTPIETFQIQLDLDSGAQRAVEGEGEGGDTMEVIGADKHTNKG